jgi:ribosomal protein L39E
MEKIDKMPSRYHKKVVLNKYNRQTKWAPVWAVIKAHGKGKRVHPSAMTAVRRSWRRSKLKIKPRRTHKRQLG